MEAVILHPLPVRDMGRLVSIETDWQMMSVHSGPLSPGEVFDLSARSDLFDELAGYRTSSVNLVGPDVPLRVVVASTMGPFFELFGVRPEIGNTYRASTARRGNDHVVVLSHAFWQTITGGAPNAIGQTLRLDNESYEVVGVMPPEFAYPSGVQLWTPRPIPPELGDKLDRSANLVTVIARMRKAMTIARLRSALTAEMASWRARYPQDYPMASRQALVVRSFADVVSGQLGPVLRLLMTTVSLVLLIACANLASLQLVRMVAREGEIALRVALGANRWRIFRQFFAESTLLAVSGGVLGVVTGAVIIWLVRRADANQLALLRHAQMDMRVFIFAGGITLFAGVLFGTLPALRAVRLMPWAVLKTTSAHGLQTGFGHRRFLRAMVILQVAFSLILCLASSVVLRSLIRLLDVNPGFQPQGLVTMRLTLPDATYRDSAQKLAFHDALVARLRSLPGVQAIGTVSGAPFGYLRANEHTMVVRALDLTGAQSRSPQANVWLVGGDYVRAMGIPLLAGRTFTDADRFGAARVAIVDETLAHELFGREEPIGRRLEGDATIVGVVGSVKKTDLSAADRGSIYEPFGQWPALADLTIVIRTKSTTASTAAAVRHIIRDIDPSLPVFDVSSMPDAIAHSLASRRLAATVLAGLAILSLTLAVLGTYGLQSYATRQCAPEIGIRMALGATPGSIVATVLKSTALLATTGAGLGVGVFVAGANALAPLSFGVHPRDLLSIVLTAGALIGVAIAASHLPALRAARIDPALTLRSGGDR